MTPRSILITLSLLAVVLLAPMSLADPAKVLEDAGLTLTGRAYVVAEEDEIIRAKRDITIAQKTLKDAENHFRNAERKIAKAQGYIAALQREIDELASKARRADDRKEYDRYVTAREQKIRDIENAQEERKKFEVQSQADVDDARAAYIATVYDWVEKAKTVTTKYDQLAENEDVIKAIQEISTAQNKRYTLGPSSRFKSIQRTLAKASEEYQRGAVDLRKEGQVLMIDVRINGKPIRSMILDTGASSISLPYTFAKDLGIQISSTDPVVELQMADGKIVDATQITLQKVQVGEFVVNDVEAFILPESLHAAPPLLGNSFLGNFTFEIDPDRGKLILSRLNEKEKN